MNAARCKLKLNSDDISSWLESELGGSLTPAPELVAASRYCLPGDLIEGEIEKIGVLRNPISSVGVPA